MGSLGQNVPTEREKDEVVSPSRGYLGAENTNGAELIRRVSRHVCAGNRCWGSAMGPDLFVEGTEAWYEVKKTAA